MPASDHHLLGATGTDEAGQPLRAATPRDDPEQDLGLAEHRLLADDAIVARHGQLAATTQGVTADGSDHEARDGRHGVERTMEPGGDDPRFVGAAELADVGTRGEQSLAPHDDDCAWQVGAERSQCVVEIAEQFLRQRVHLRIVQRDDRNTVVASLDQHQVTHGGDSTQAPTSRSI